MSRKIQFLTEDLVDAQIEFSKMKRAKVMSIRVKGVLKSSAKEDGEVFVMFGQRMYKIEKMLVCET